MIVVTGGAGFIGSAFIWKLNAEGITDILVVDEVASSEQVKNLTKRRFASYLHKTNFLRLLQNNSLPAGITALVHLGACSSTLENNVEFVMKNNYHYSRYLAQWALNQGIRFVYASSAATYGNGTQGFSDDHTSTLTLCPLNVYGNSKHLFDVDMIRSGGIQQAAGLKFFNVFGPNEYHKGEMASLVYKACRQISETNRITLFQSHSPDFADGEAKRDFLYVKEAVEVLWWMLQRPDVAGIFNVGTGTACSWNNLARAICGALKCPVNVDYLPMPNVLQNHYQYFTQADITKLRQAGCAVMFPALIASVRDYIENYMVQKDRFL